VPTSPKTASRQSAAGQGRAHAAEEGAGGRLCASIEAEIADLDDADKIDFLADGPEEPASTA
jgi:hypothetical protein